ncbi:NERD domain-containing protein [Domibacillus indicus]|uniref:NERD domain-containing protein n=1 Tax=Domibacillus indicus TaxID=1437523 RepID=UPI00203F4EB2|nr:NERD domain-containing protein [Domibacillus indicus]MCM3789849.1 NERD domain-containing protein [Domibacillus indicus]
MGFIVLLLLGAIMISAARFSGSSRRKKGVLGERTVQEELDKLDRAVYTVFHDLYIPRSNGRTAQIDHLVLSKHGIFVIETKNFSGRIFGDESEKYWIQKTLKRRETFYNPIWQNAGHIRALKEFFGHSNGIKYYSFIAFTRKSQLELEEPFKEASVLYADQLVEAFCAHRKQRMNAVLVRELAEKLEPFNEAGRRKKRAIEKKHVRAIKSGKRQRERNKSEGVCPRCGGALVKRTGRYGAFKGCSHFPECRFTKVRED